jgi:hypothetical protein
MDRVDLLDEEDARGPNIIVSDNSQSAAMSSTLSNTNTTSPRSGVVVGRSPMWREALIGGLAAALLAVAVMGLLYLIARDLLGA